MYYNKSGPYRHHQFSIMLDIMIIKLIFNGIKKVLKSLKFNMVNPAETLLLNH